MLKCSPAGSSLAVYRVPWCVTGVLSNLRTCGGHVPAGTIMQSYAVSKLLLGVSMSALLMACHASRPLVGGPTVAIQPLPAHEARQLQQARRNILGLDAKDKDVRILAFGDSITEGWVNTAWVKTPWTPIVQQKLQQRLAGWNVELVNGGIGSAGVLDLLNEAFKRQLQDAKSAGKPFHYIIFEAGINDILMQHRNTPEIFDRMKELWSLANADGSTVVVIPPLPTDAQ
eukprot:GHRR01012298.1.p1 GENE.GHRR01012298.1~~GHRR01012298.1.p1  ORF type:complete len:229 (+),score=66.60 GHRR01012298.1:89-775(+)